MFFWCSKKSTWAVNWLPATGSNNYWTECIAMKGLASTLNNCPNINNDFCCLKRSVVVCILSRAKTQQTSSSEMCFLIAACKKLVDLSRQQYLFMSIYISYWTNFLKLKFMPQCKNMYMCVLHLFCISPPFGHLRK